MNTFYTVTQTVTVSSSDYIFSVVLNTIHRIYEGHFPQQPVVPGVCMIQMIREVAEKVTGQALMFSSITNIKFLALVVPTVNSQLTIKLSLDKIDDGFSAKASVESGDKTFLSLKGNLSAVKTCSDANFSAVD